MCAVEAILLLVVLTARNGLIQFGKITASVNYLHTRIGALMAYLLERPGCPTTAEGAPLQRSPLQKRMQVMHSFSWRKQSVLDPIDNQQLPLL